MNKPNMKIVIDPKVMLRVEITNEDGQGSKEYLTFLCRFLPVKNFEGRTVTAFELIYEPSGQGSNGPKAPYEVAHDTIERVIVDPRRLKDVQPYIVE